MTLPYAARIMALIGGEPFELARFKRMPFPSALRYYTEGLDAYWWIERTLTDRETITSRPVIRDMIQKTGPKFHLNHEELHHESH